MRENKQLTSIELAKLAKSKGFNDVCDNAYCLDREKIAYYISYDPGYFKNNDLWEKHFAAPRREELHAWLRDKGVIIVIDVDQTFEPKFCYSIAQFDKNTFEWKNHDPSGTALFYTYEAALEEALMEGLKLL